MGAFAEARRDAPEPLLSFYRFSMTRRFPATLLFASAVAVAPLSATRLPAQTLDDADFMGRRVACATVLYLHDAWQHYWEGPRKRTNDNIGTLSTQEVSTMGAYGVTKHLTLLATLPYVRTNASQGVLQGQRGLQDLTVAAKMRLLSTPFTSLGTMQVIAVAGAGLPVSDYTPDFLPMSIGSAAKRVIGRGTLSFQSKRGWFVNGSAGYTKRSNVTLARPAYYTNGQLTLSNDVRMPDVSDYVVALGWQGKGWDVIAPLTTQRTLGGGDIRRQDMPFVSNRMDFKRLDARVRYTLPKLPAVMAQVGASRVLRGRNVGQSTGVSAGVVVLGRPW